MAAGRDRREAVCDENDGRMAAVVERVLIWRGMLDRARRDMVAVRLISVVSSKCVRFEGLLCMY